MAVACCVGSAYLDTLLENGRSNPCDERSSARTSRHNEVHGAQAGCRILNAQVTFRFIIGYRNSKQGIIKIHDQYHPAVAQTTTTTTTNNNTTTQQYNAGTVMNLPRPVPATPPRTPSQHQRASALSHPRCRNAQPSRPRGP